MIQNFWLDRWSTHPSDDTFYAGWYGAVGTLADVVFLLQVCTFAFGALKASSCTAHLLSTETDPASDSSSMLQGVLRSPSSFFNTTLTGRIVNRFMVDQALLDETVAAAQKLFQFVGTVVAVAYISPIMLAFLVGLAFPYFYLARRYALPARDLRRIESVQRSPVLSLFSECMKG